MSELNIEELKAAALAATPDELKVVAVVSMNGRESLVINRPLNITYEKVGNDFIGSDGPFREALYYERGAGRFVAFAGRELNLTMKNGSIQKVKDHWWNGMIKGLSSVAASDVETLKRCYVFTGGMCADPVDLAALRSTYTGPIYSYWDYEKIINHDDMRKNLWDKIFHFEKRCRALVQEVKSKHAENTAMIKRLQVAEDAAKRAYTGSAEPIAYLCEQDANTDNACLFVANKTDIDSFAVYTALLPTDVKYDISEGYLGSTAATTEDGFKITIHYKSKLCGDAAYTVITDLIDASIDAKESAP